jgi:rubrerythrin
MRNDILKREPEILGWITSNQSKAFMCKELKCKPVTLNNWLDKMGYDYKGNQGGKNIKKDPKRKTALEYMKSTHVKSYKLKAKLLEDGLKEYICESCEGTEWVGKPIPLELHHVDGNHYNNELDNLELLCPNCHALTENYRGKNIVKNK